MVLYPGPATILFPSLPPQALHTASRSVRS